MRTKEDLRPIEPDDLFRLKFLQAACLSPDGKRVAYSVLTTDAEQEEDRVAIWLISLDTGEARQLTAGLARDTDPQWSPDGKRIAFLSTRGEKTQLYVIPVDGGEAQALTAMKQGVGGGPLWSPDGKLVAFTAAAREEPRDPTKPYRVTRHIYRLDGAGYVQDFLQDIFVISVDGGEPKRLISADYQKTPLAWSTDGQEILVTAGLFPNSHRIRPKLRAVNLEGKVRELVGSWGHAGSGEWTPDGRRVVFLGQPEGRTYGSKSELWVVDSQGGEPECRTAELVYEVGGRLQADMPATVVGSKPIITEDGEAAYVQVQQGGTLQLYRIALDGDESCVPVVTGDRSCILFGSNDERLLYAVATFCNPPDLYICKMDGSEERRLTDLNGEVLKEMALPTVERLLFPGTDGDEVEAFVLKPAMGEPPYPTILYIHGGPHAAFGYSFHSDFQMLTGAGYAVLAVNYHGSTGYGDAFGTRIYGDLGFPEYGDLMAAVDFAIEKGITDEDRLGCCGLSQGGFLSCFIVGQTDRFKAAVPENGVSDWATYYGVTDIGPGYAVPELGGAPHEIPEVYRRASPITYAHRCKTPTLLIQSEHDRRATPEQAEQFYATLKANGCTVEMLRLPDMPHAGSRTGPVFIRSAQNEALLDWMNRYVLG